MPVDVPNVPLDSAMLLYIVSVRAGDVIDPSSIVLLTAPLRVAMKLGIDRVASATFLRWPALGRRPFVPAKARVRLI